MRKKIAVCSLIVLLICLLVTIIVDVRITWQISSRIEFLPYDSPIREIWGEMIRDRGLDIVFLIIIFIVIMFLVLKIGPQKELPKHISQEEAQNIAADLEEQYRNSGVYVTSEADTVEDDLVETLDIPIMKSANYVNRCVEVTWYPVNHADGYSVWRRTGDQRWTRIKRLHSESCSYRDYYLDGETKYSYTVKAFTYIDGKQIVSKKDSLGVDVFVPEGNIPEIPKISKRLDEDGREYLTWTKIPHVKVYRILRKEIDGEWMILTRVAQSAPRVFRDESAQSGNIYCYTVSAHRMFDGIVVSSDFDEEGITLRA